MYLSCFWKESDTTWPLKDKTKSGSLIFQYEKTDQVLLTFIKETIRNKRSAETDLGHAPVPCFTAVDGLSFPDLIWALARCREAASSCAAFMYNTSCSTRLHQKTGAENYPGN